MSRIIDKISDRFRGRPDSEVEQATIRLGIVAIVFVYFLIAGLVGGFTHRKIGALWFLGFYIAFSIGILASIAASEKKVSVVRRGLGMVGDIGGTSYLLYGNGESSAPLFVILLWVTFGNGFRFGRKYLFAATFLSAVCFAAVLYVNPYWRSHGPLAIGLLIGIIVLPAYVSTLLKKLTDAIARGEEANRAKNQFLANMSHEMRTPLNGIIGMVDLLMDTPLTTEQKEFSHTARASAYTLLSLVEDVLDISKIEAGKITVEKVGFDLHSLVKETTAMLTPQAQAKGLRLTAQVRSDIPFQLRGDPFLIRQILLNLLGNAVKFTDSGEVRLGVERTAETLVSVTLKIAVADTGIGIAPEAQPRIFSRFTQADDSITRRFGGTGLGTTIAKELVELMGGQIGLSSEPGVGSTFWFTVELEKQPAALSPAAESNGIGGCRVLIVSADAATTRCIREHLSSWGIVPVVVERAADAFGPLVSAAKERTPFQIAIVVEHGLDMDSFELARALKSVHVFEPVQLILAAEGERGSNFESLTRDGYGGAVGVPVDKTMLFNALHFVRPDKSEEPGITRLASRYQQKIGDRRTLRILVAEDNAINQKVIGRVLERAGHACRIVENGEMALDALETEPFDVVLMDLQMPVMGGLEAAKIYRLAHTQGPRVPIVALTADATQEAAKACAEAGMDACVTKPIEARKLLEMIGTLVPAAKKPVDGIAPSLDPVAPAAAPGHGRETRPGLDPATIGELKALGGTGDFFENLIGIFLETGEQKLRDMETAAGSRNYGRFREIAHAMKGSAGQVGAFPLMEICHELARIGPAELEENGPLLVTRLKDEFERVRSELSPHLKKPGSGYAAS